jgi:hypothetical protein
VSSEPDPIPKLSGSNARVLYIEKRTICEWHWEKSKVHAVRLKGTFQQSFCTGVSSMRVLPALRMYMGRVSAVFFVSHSSSGEVPKFGRDCDTVHLLTWPILKQKLLDIKRPRE